MGRNGNLESAHDDRIPDHRLARQPAGRDGGAAARDGGHRQRQLQQARHRRGRRGGPALHGRARHPRGDAPPAEARRLPACRGAVGRPLGQRRRQHRADGPSRHCLSRWRGLAPAVHHPRRRRLRAGCRRHEGGAGDELLRARRVREVRRRAGADARAVHRRRGDRQPGRPRGDRGARRAAPASCSTPSRGASPATW